MSRVAVSVAAITVMLAGALHLRARPRPALESDMQQNSPRWWKGNTHTHTLWSDGDDFPEMVASWYKTQGYHFLAITDHNTLATEDRWWPVPASGLGREAYDKYRARFGAWVSERRSADTTWVRLRGPVEYRSRLEEPGRFLLVDGEEITQYLARKGAHMNALNLAEVILPQAGATLVEMFRRDLEQVQAQERRTGREIVAVLNHPNFLWSQTAEDLLELLDLRFFEVYNGHPLVNILGDSVHAGNERLWDVVLTDRAVRDRVLLYGVATDDSHDYHRIASAHRNAGRGWVMVRAESLTADSIMAAMKRGDFYATSGVELTDLRREGRRLALTIRAELGVVYTTQFVGTRRAYDTTSVAVRDTAGTLLTRRYSQDVGAVLAEVHGSTPSYMIRGDELYVRARVVSSRAKANASYAGEHEMAWTQPLRP
jgi:hypothetical protein